jgi:hypothetical protein
MTNSDSENPIAEAVHESAVSWRETAGWARIAMTLGLVAFLLFSFVAFPGAPHGLIPVLRTLGFAAMLIGAVGNARSADAFFRQVYLEGCAFAVVASAVLFYAAATYHVELGVNAVSLLLATVLAGMAISFFRLRRA